MPVKDPSDLGSYAIASSTTRSTGRAQSNTSVNSKAEISFTNNNPPHSILSSDSTSVEVVEVIPNQKATEKHEHPQDREKEDSGGENEYESDSQEEFEEIESPNCINPDYLLHSDTPRTDSSEECQTSPIIPTPEAESNPRNKECSVVPVIPEAYPDGCRHSEESSVPRRSQRLTVGPTSVTRDRVSGTVDPASTEASCFNVLAFNANTRTAIRSWTGSFTATNIGNKLTDTNSGERPIESRSIENRPIESPPIAQRGNIPRFVNIPRFTAPGSGKNCVQFASSSSAARPNPSDPGRNYPNVRSCSVRDNRLETATTSTRPTTRSIATASIPIDPDLAPRLPSLQRWSNRVHDELTSGVHAQEQLVDLRWRASDTLYNLGHQLDEVSDLTRRLHRQQKEIRKREDLAREAAARKRGRRQE